MGSSASPLLDLPFYLYDVRENLDEPHHPLKPHGKYIVFIRHGQSTANVITDEAERHTERHRDARLTPIGETQARALRQRVSRAGITAVIVSPLSRAIQTACLAFEETAPDVQLVCDPEVTEFYGALPECQGRPREVLKADSKLTSLTKFAYVDLSGVQKENWWVDADDRSRILRVMARLRDHPAERICVVSHWGFIRGLIRAAGYRHELKLQNCAWIETIWYPKPDPHLHIAERRLYGVVLLPSGNRSQDGKGYPTLLKEILSFFNACHRSTELRTSTFLRLGHMFHFTLTPFRHMSGFDAESLGQHLWLTSRELIRKTNGTWRIPEDSVRLHYHSGDPAYVTTSFSSIVLEEERERLLGLSCFNHPTEPHEAKDVDRVVRATSKIDGMHFRLSHLIFDETRGLEEYHPLLQRTPELWRVVKEKDAKTLAACLSQMRWKVSIVSCTLDESNRPSHFMFESGGSFQLYEP